MLQKISIQNYAIIDQIEIEFSGNLNIITGETGAGKSIIAGALGLVLGDRADTSVLVNKEKKCIVEGLFSAASNTSVNAFLEQYDLEKSEELIIRREIGANGKSRAFVNDTPVTLSQLNELSAALVDLHRQFDSMQLGENNFQLQVLDALADQHELVLKYRKTYEGWKKALKEFEELQDKKKQFDLEADYNRFQFEELNEAAFRENELEDIEAELKMLNHSEEIKTVLSGANNALSEGEDPLVQQLKQILNQLNPYSAFHPALPSLLQRLESSQLEIRDIADEISQLSEKINYDPEKIQIMDDRLSLGVRLQKKHNVQSTQELLEIRNQLGNKLNAILDIEEELNRKEKESDELFKAARLLAEQITEGRKKQKPPFEKKVNQLLAQVGMPNARIRVSINILEELSPGGNSSVEFLFNANSPSDNRSGEEHFLPLRKVASGGELNRLMLCIKSLVASRLDLPTLVFDEIDTGISGEAARQVGVILKELAGNRQIISITHQPQIAGKADAHFFVYKEIENDQIRTHIRRLTVEERISAIAKMLSGEKPTAAAMENAKEMVRN